MSTETTAPDPRTARSAGAQAPGHHSGSRWAITAADAARIATFAALICVLSISGSFQVIGGMAPITLQTLGVMLAGALLGAYRGALAVITFLLLALAGLPLLAGGTGGPGAFVGASSGYLYGWIFGAALIGWLVDHIRGKVTFGKVFAAALAGGIGVVYLFGVPVTAFVTGISVGTIAVKSAVYLPGDVAKAVITALVTVAVVKAYPGGISCGAAPALTVRLFRRDSLGAGDETRDATSAHDAASSGPLPLRLDDVHVTLGERVVLRGVDLELTQQRIGIIGANGSGKSTLARLLNGLVLPTRGRVRVGELDTARDGSRIRRLVGFVFTDPDAQIVMPTVAEDVAYSLRPRRGEPGLDPVRRDALVHAALVERGLADHADHPAHLLSGGQKQLLAITSVLVGAPRILVADEPTTLLDLRNARAIHELFLGLEQQVVVVTHDLDQLTGYDRVLVVDDGKIVADDEPGPAIAWYRRAMGAS